MQNAFVAALLQTAAEHRLKAEQLRSLVEPGPPSPSWPTPFRHFAEWLYEDTMKRANEQDELAEVYQRFADKIIAEVAGELILQEATRLFEPAEIQFQVPGTFGDLIPRQWQMNYMRYYRGIDLNSPRYWMGGGV